MSLYPFPYVNILITAFLRVFIMHHSRRTSRRAIWESRVNRRCYCYQQQTDTPVEKIKAARHLIDEHALIPPVMMELLTWAAHYYQHPIGEVFSAALPTLVTARRSTIRKHESLATDCRRHSDYRHRP
jgi:primosomal protein N'